ncbi:hypothetical protein [Sphaerisporangium sp. NPDC051011]|uniref:hypothetical protein n=1 Tax=Sphaerisporangium sp. NPDC051011 TaxID=3155792 RepID=UPI00340101B2
MNPAAPVWRAKEPVRPGRLAKAITRTRNRLLKRLIPNATPRVWPRTLKKAWHRYQARRPGHHGRRVTRDLVTYRVRPAPSG